MVKINSTSRLLSIDSEVILTQTDTTVGFLSQDETKLQKIKNRPKNKHFIKVYKNIDTLKQTPIRIPSLFKAKVRRAKKTSFIVKNTAFRVAEDRLDSSFLRAFQWNHSTSANEAGKNFQRDFCEQKADIIIEDKNTLCQGQASMLYKINNTKIKRLR